MDNHEADDRSDLLARWKKTNPQRWTTDAVEEHLKQGFCAYEIPLEAITRTDYSNDGEVREDLIYSLYTITHPDVLSRLYSAEEKEMKDVGPDTYDESWRRLFLQETSGSDTDDLGTAPLGDASWLAYNLLNTQHLVGQRTSIVLEQEDGLVTGAKVYGMSDHLTTYMTALTGYRETGTETDQNYYSMKTGDVNDEAFVYYLDCLARHSFI